MILLSDDEAANVASILRRMNERVEDAEDHTVAYVDERGPTDFARQLEALADAGDPNVYAVTSTIADTPVVSATYPTRITADTHAAKVGGVHVQKVPLKDTADAVDPDDTDELPE